MRREDKRSVWVKKGDNAAIKKKREREKSITENKEKENMKKIRICGFIPE